MNALVRALTLLARRLADPGDPLGARARADLASDGALSPAMADRVLRTTTARYTPTALDALGDGSLAGRDVRVLLAASVPTAPLRALALPLLRGAAHVSVRPSRRQPRFVETLRAVAPFDRVDTLAGPPAAGLIPGAHVIAYGRDETLAALRAALPPGVRFEGHGHGYGVVVVTAGVDPDSVATAIARDVADYDQRGCLSPQGVYVAGTLADADALARALHEALARELPRGPMDPSEAARVMQWQGVMAVQGAALRRGGQHAVATVPVARAPMSPGARNVSVAPVTDLAEIARCLAAEARYLTCVGVAGDPGAIVLPPGATPRVVAAGTMQDPALDGPEDRRGLP